MKIPLLNFYDLAGVSVPLMLGILALAALVLDLMVGRKKPQWLAGFAIAGMTLTIFFQAILHVKRADVLGHIGAGFGGLIAFDLFGIFFNYLFLAAAILAAALSIIHLKGKAYNRGEYYILLLLATAGMCLLVAARDLIMVFIGLEAMSLPVYALTASDRGNMKSNEAGLKYLLLGGFASALLLFGIALLYGASAGTDFQTVSAAFEALPRNDIRYVFMIIGLGVFIAGFAFKIGAVPFHMWLPDVYEGAPTPVTAYMAAGVKAAAFALLIRVFITAFNGVYLSAQGQPWLHVHFYNVLYALAVLTMTAGNLIALSQTNIKRLLAYSSIAHAGYLLVGLTSLLASGRLEEALGAGYTLIYYLAVYLFMTIGAFAVVVVLGAENRGGEEINDYAGLARSRPFLASAMAVFMFSLAGMPPLGGFAAKFFIFQSAVQHGLYYLTVIAVVNSVIAAYYYLKVIYVMYMQKERERVREPGLETGALANAVLILTMVMVIIMGLAPGRFLNVILLTLIKLG